MRGRELALAAAALAAVAWEREVLAWTGPGPRTHLLVALWTLVAGLPVTGVGRTPIAGAGRRALGVASVLAPAFALVLGRDLAAGRAVDLPACAMGIVAAAAWTAAAECGTSGPRTRGLVAGAWALLVAGPLLAAFVLEQAAPFHEGAGALARLFPGRAAHDLASGGTAARWVPLLVAAAVAAAARWSAGREEDDAA